MEGDGRAEHEDEDDGEGPEDGGAREVQECEPSAAGGGRLEAERVEEVRVEACEPGGDDDGGDGPGPE